MNQNLDNERLVMSYLTDLDNLAGVFVKSFSNPVSLDKERLLVALQSIYNLQTLLEGLLISNEEADQLGLDFDNTSG